MKYEPIVKTAITLQVECALVSTKAVKATPKRHSLLRVLANLGAMSREGAKGEDEDWSSVESDEVNDMHEEDGISDYSVKEEEEDEVDSGSGDSELEEGSGGATPQLGQIGLPHSMTNPTTPFLKQVGLQSIKKEAIPDGDESPGPSREARYQPGPKPWEGQPRKKDRKSGEDNFKARLPPLNPLPEGIPKTSDQLGTHVHHWTGCPWKISGNPKSCKVQEKISCICCGIKLGQAEYLWDSGLAIWCKKCFSKWHQIPQARGIICVKESPVIPVVAPEVIIELEMTGQVICNSLWSGPGTTVTSRVNEGYVFYETFVKVWRLPSREAISTLHLMDGRIVMIGQKLPEFQAPKPTSAPAPAPAPRPTTFGAHTQTDNIKWSRWENVGEILGMEPVTPVKEDRGAPDQDQVSAIPQSSPQPMSTGQPSLSTENAGAAAAHIVVSKPVEENKDESEEPVCKKARCPTPGLKEMKKRNTPLNYSPVSPCVIRRN